MFAHSFIHSLIHPSLNNCLLSAYSMKRNVLDAERNRKIEKMI